MPKLICLLLLGIACSAQSQTIEELKDVYDKMQERGSYDSAIGVAFRVRDLIEAKSGKDNIEYALVMTHLASLHQATDQLALAKDLMMQGLEIRRRIQPADHPDIALTLYELSILYFRLGQYQEAEPLLLESLRAITQHFGKDDEQAGKVNHVLGSLYIQLGQIDKAESHLGEAIRIRKLVFGTAHPDYAASISNMAVLYFNTGREKEAFKYFEEALVIRKNYVGENHPLYAESLNNLANLYTDAGDYDRAEQLLLESIRIKQGRENINYSRNLSNLGALYKAKGEYVKAIDYFERGLAVAIKIHGLMHNDNVNDFLHLSQLYESIGNIDKAEETVMQAVSIEVDAAQKVFNVLSDRERLEYLYSNFYSIDGINTLIHKHGGSATLRRTALDLLLLTKSFSLSDVQARLKSVRDGSDSLLAGLYREWLQKRKDIAYEYSLPLVERSANLKEMEKEAEEKEKQLFRSVNIVNGESSRATFQALSEKLKEKEVAIEFVVFSTRNINPEKDSTYYGAYVVKKSMESPVFVSLFNEVDMDRILARGGNDISTLVKSFYRGLAKKKDSSATYLGDSLYKLVWQPLEGHLKDIKSVNFSPVGVLNNISLKALPVNGSGNLLFDQFILNQFTSTRHIINSGDKADKTHLTIFGNPKYTLDPSGEASGPGNGVRTNWSDLPGTQSEIDKISSLFRKRGSKVEVFSQSIASEKNLKQLSGKKIGILHIATHGFYVMNEEEQDKEPLMNSGLVFAGANDQAGGEQVNSENDGVATSYEISQLDLSRTELVILSACETGLGAIRGTEGVYGLQRAFKMAGVKKMIVSLWQVPDKETAELMTSFYTYWLEGKNIEEAFSKAQGDMRKKYDPFYWAAFVLVE